MKKLLAVCIAFCILALPLTVSAAGNIYETAEKRTFQNETTALPYRLILPEGYDASVQYPLVLFLHGAGERGNDNQLQFFHCVQYLADNLPDCIIVAPQCPVGNQWVDTPWSNGAYSIETVPESNELAAVVELLTSLQEEFSIDSNRIYATGISMGGFGVWDLMMRHNDFFAAGVAVCGGGDPTQAELLKETPLFVFHGDSDSAVPVSGSRDTVQAILDAGGNKVSYVEYAGAEHGIWNDAFATEGLLDSLLACDLSDRYPEKAPAAEESSEEESVWEVSEPSTAVSAAESTADDQDGIGALPIVIAVIAIVLVAAIAVIVIVLRKRK